MKFGKELYCKGNSDLLSRWPTSWNACIALLRKAGYKKPITYYVCLNTEHQCFWSITDCATDTCKYCNKKGEIEFYYLTLADKIRRWCSFKTCCQKMTAYWRQKEHWIDGPRREVPYKELWDGERFAELSWFWDPNKQWLLPTRCINCQSIISAKVITATGIAHCSQSPHTEEDTTQHIITVECSECHFCFNHNPSYAKRQIKQRKKLYNKAKHLQTEEAWRDYRNIKNNITMLIRESHRKYQNKMFSDDGGINYKKFWRYVKTIRRDIHGIAPLKVENSFVYHSEDQAEILNKQFQSVFTKEDLSNIPECCGPSIPPLHNITISVDGVKKLLSTLDSSKSCGPDNIPARILKHCCDEIAPILTVIFTQSLSSGNLPDDWLMANVTPIFKKGDRASPTNYRPISLTSICCKLLEHILYHCITEHLKTYQILSDKQYGFRPNHSCETQLLSIVEEIQSAMNHHLSIDLIFIDFRKAFDTVPHQRLLTKLHHYEFKGMCIIGYPAGLPRELNG